jgi:hypothetical protein
MQSCKRGYLLGEWLWLRDLTSLRFRHLVLVLWLTSDHELKSLKFLRWMHRLSENQEILADMQEQGLISELS